MADLFHEWHASHNCDPGPCRCKCGCSQQMGCRALSGLCSMCHAAPQPAAPQGWREAMEDIAIHGLRIDCNPTVMFPKDEAERRGAMAMYSWWVQYIRDAEKRLKERARTILSSPPESAKEPKA